MDGAGDTPTPSWRVHSVPSICISILPSHVFQVALHPAESPLSCFCHDWMATVHNGKEK